MSPRSVAPRLTLSLPADQVTPAPGQMSLRQEDLTLLESRRSGPDQIAALPVSLAGLDLSAFMAEVKALAGLIHDGAAAGLGLEKFGEATLGLVEHRLGLPLIDGDFVPAGRTGEVRLIWKPSEAFREFMAALRAGDFHA